MHEYEKKIKEQRTAEAIKKDLMGFDGKIGCIVRNMGQPIIAHTQGGMYFNSTSNYDFESIPGEETLPGELLPGNAEDICRQIPTLGIEGYEEPEGDIWMERNEPIFESTREIGWLFSGLSRGMDLEIKYDNESKELLLKYKGVTVFRETAGDLESYVPKTEWENMINQLHAIAKKIQMKRNKEEKTEKKETIKIKKLTWLENMKKKWGF